MFTVEAKPAYTSDGTNVLLSLRHRLLEQTQKIIDTEGESALTDWDRIQLHYLKYGYGMRMLDVEALEKTVETPQPDNNGSVKSGCLEMVKKLNELRIAGMKRIIYLRERNIKNDLGFKVRPLPGYSEVLDPIDPNAPRQLTPLSKVLGPETAVLAQSVHTNGNGHPKVEVGA